MRGAVFHLPGKGAPKGGVPHAPSQPFRGVEGVRPRDVVRSVGTVPCPGPSVAQRMAPIHWNEFARIALVPNLGLASPRMASGDKFRTRARECVEVADSMADPVHKLVLLEIAQRWLDLATRQEWQREPPGDAFLDESETDQPLTPGITR